MMMPTTKLDLPSPTRTTKQLTQVPGLLDISDKTDLSTEVLLHLNLATTTTAATMSLKKVENQELPGFIMLLNNNYIENMSCFECTPSKQAPPKRSNPNASSSTCFDCEECGCTRFSDGFKAISHCEVCNQTRCHNCVEFLVCDDPDCHKSHCADCRDEACNTVEQCEDCFESFCSDCIMKNYEQNYGHACHSCPGYVKKVIPYENELMQDLNDDLQNEFSDLQSKADRLQKQMEDWINQFEAPRALDAPPDLQSSSEVFSDSLEDFSYSSSGSNSIVFA